MISAVKESAQKTRQDLVEICGGDQESVETSVRALLHLPHVLEAWCTQMIWDRPVAELSQREFKFSEIPEKMRENAMRAVAVAYLVWKEEEEQREVAGYVSELRIVG